VNLISKQIWVKSEKDFVDIYPLGDVHIGALNCAEGHFRKCVNHILKQPNALWVGGGDHCDCITPQDLKRFDARSLPDWLFSGPASTIKDALSDIALQQRKRFVEIVDPIKDKCIGLIEGNHESDIMKYSNNAHHYIMCEELKSPNLTDVSGIRFDFKCKVANNVKGSSVTIFVFHGWGGGRSDGAEPNKLRQLVDSFDADIVIRGHSHTFDIRPPQLHLYMPRRGAMPDELIERRTYKGNWGCWLKSYAVGAPTYDSRANYPARPLSSMQIRIKPFNQYNVTVCGKRTTRSKPVISMREWDVEGWFD